MSFLATGLLLAGLIAPAQAEDGPPLLLELEVQGETIPVRLGEPFSVKVGGKSVDMTLNARPYRVFQEHGISFHYPSQHAWSLDDSEPGTLIYTMDGQTNVLMLMSYSVPVPPSAIRDTMLGFIVNQYGEQNVRKSDTSINLGGKSYDGVRLDVVLAGEKLRQDIYALQGPESVLVLVVQDSPNDDGTPSAESIQATKLLTGTWTTE